MLISIAKRWKNSSIFTNYAAASDDDRPVFAGALLEIKDANDKEVTMVATDTHRMAVKKVTIDETCDVPYARHHSNKGFGRSISFIANR